jgi:hypothetical protein
MSTYWYFECMGHSPPLRSVDEFTQHTDDHYFKHAVNLANARPLKEVDDDLNGHIEQYYDGNARRFLVNHPTCSIELVNDYGVRRALGAAGDELMSDAVNTDTQREALSVVIVEAINDGPIDGSSEFADRITDRVVAAGYVTPGISAEEDELAAFLCTRRTGHVLLSFEPSGADLELARTLLGRYSVTLTGPVVDYRDNS